MTGTCAQNVAARVEIPFTGIGGTGTGKEQLKHPGVIRSRAHNRVGNCPGLIDNDRLLLISVLMILLCFAMVRPEAHLICGALCVPILGEYLPASGRDLAHDCCVSALSFPNGAQNCLSNGPELRPSRGPFGSFLKHSSDPSLGLASRAKGALGCEARRSGACFLGFDGPRPNPPLRFWASWVIDARRPWNSGIPEWKIPSGLGLQRR